MKLNAKQQLYVLVLIFGLIVAGEGTYGYFCLEERAQLLNDLHGLELDERDAKQKIAQIPVLRTQASEMAAIIEKYVAILPTAEEVRYEAFLVDIDNFARDAGLELLSGSSEQVKETRFRRRDQKAQGGGQNNFQRHRYRFRLQGQFLNFLKFMNGVENHRRYLRIDDFSIRPIDAEERDRGLDEIILAEDPRKEIEVVISTYTYSKATAAPPTPKKK